MNQILQKREQEIIYIILKELISHHYSDENRNPQFQYFGKLKPYITEWFRTKITCKGDFHKNMIVYSEAKHICSHIQKGLKSVNEESEWVVPVFSQYDRIGSTSLVNGNSSKKNSLFPTKKSQVNYVVADSDWEKRRQRHWKNHHTLFLM